MVVIAMGQVELAMSNQLKDKISFFDAPRFRDVDHARRGAMLEHREFLTIIR